MRYGRRQAGQALTEYVVVTLAVTAALFVPWNGEQSPMVLLLEAVRTFHAHSSFALSLP